MKPQSWSIAFNDCLRMTKTNLCWKFTQTLKRVSSFKGNQTLNKDVKRSVKNVYAKHQPLSEQNNLHSHSSSAKWKLKNDIFLVGIWKKNVCFGLITNELYNILKHVYLFFNVDYSTKLGRNKDIKWFLYNIWNRQAVKQMNKNKDTKTSS